MSGHTEVDRVFKALADPTRRAILGQVQARALPVVAIAGLFPDISRPAISKHLRILREAGLVEENKQGRKRLYRLRRSRLDAVGSWLENVGRAQVRRPRRRRKKTRAAAASPRVPAPQPTPDDDWRAW